jgi:hypothetical protein
MTHLGTFREKFEGRLVAAVRPMRFVVYGTPNNEVKESFYRFSSIYHRLSL